MTFSCKVGSFVTGTGAATTTVAVTGVGFQPSFVLFWWNGRTDTTDAVGGADHRRGFGFMSATERAYATSQSQDGASTMVCDGGQGIDACVAVLSSAGAIDGALDFSAFGADGFTLVVDNAMPDSMRVHYMAIGGTDITNIDIGTFTEPGSVGTQDVTGPGFQPDCVIVIAATNNGADPPTVGSDSALSFGVTAGSSPTNYVWAGGSNDAAAAAQALSYCRTGECLARLSGGITTVNGRAGITSWLSTGFQLTWSESSSAGARFIYAALKGGKYAVGDLLTQTDTTTDIVESGLGFSPVGALFVSHCKTQSTSDTAQDDDEWSMGAFSDASTERAMGSFDDDAADPSVVATAVEHDNVYVKIASDAVESSMQCITVGSDGFTCEMTDAAAAQAFVWYLAVGTAAAEYTGSSAGTGTASASLTALASYVGSSAGVCTPSAVLNGATAYAGSSAGVATCSGIADAAASYVGSCAGVATQAGELTALASYVGTAAGTGTPSAALTGIADYACAASGLATCSGAATAALNLSGTSAGVGYAGAGITIPQEPMLEPTPEYRRGLALEMLRRRQH